MLKVNQVDLGQGLTVGPLLQGQKPVDPLLGPGARAQSRRGAPQDYGAVVVLAPPNRHLAGIVAGIAVLLVRSFMFFINDDQAQVGYRGKNGAAGANDHPGLAPANPAPFVVLFPF